MIKQLAQNLTLPWVGTSASVNGPLEGGAAGMGVGGLVSSAMKLVFLFGGIGLLLMLLLGGFTFLTSAGDAKSLEKGKQQITYAILGFFIIFSAYWMVQIFGFVFGFDAIKAIFG